MNVRATAKFVGTSSRKVGLVAALVRGRKAREAEVILSQTAKRATNPVGKVLKSAVANAENNYNLNARDLVVESVLVGPGPTLKRYRPRAQGRAFPVRKRSSHITVVLSDGTSKQVAATTAAAQVTAPKTDEKPRADAQHPVRDSRPKSAAKKSTASRAVGQRSNQKKGAA